LIFDRPRRIAGNIADVSASLLRASALSGAHEARRVDKSHKEFHTMFFRRIAVTILITAAAPIFGQNKDVLTSHSREMYGGVTRAIARAAELTPQKQYDYRPVRTVRTFGEIVRHVAETQYLFCSMALGQPNPAPKIASKASKTDLLAALEASFIYCDQMYDRLDEDTGQEMVAFMGSAAPRLGIMNTNIVHSTEHYGNLVTYMRLNGLIPPTSDPEFMKQFRK
jgi:uncharacterized damage-inducible protein DinB